MATNKRRRVFAWKPEWEGSVKAWTVKFAVANVWRVSPACDVDDLVQDGYVFFRMIEEVYPDAGPRNFMALYMRTFVNHVHDLATSRTRRKQQALPVGLDVASRGLSGVGDLAAEIPDVFNDIFTHIFRLPYKRHEDGRRETRRELFARLAGLDPETNDLVSAMRAWFNGESDWPRFISGKVA